MDDAAGRWGSTRARTARGTPTRSATCTWPPARSAARAAGRCRSPGSRTPWAAARWATWARACPASVPSRPPRTGRSSRRSGGCRAGTIRTDVGPGTIEMFAQLAAGDIKACWIICTNPVATVANRSTVIAGLEAGRARHHPGRLPRHRDQRLRRHRAARRDVGRGRRRDGQLRAQPHAAGAGDPAAGRRAAGLAADLPGRRAHGVRRRLHLQVQRGDLRRDPPDSTNLRTGYDLRGVSYDRLRETPLQWPRRTERAPDRNPIRYLNDGSARTSYVDPDGPAAAAGVPDPDAPGGVPPPPAHGRPRAARRRLPGRAQHRTPATPVAHDDQDRQGRQAEQAEQRAVRRGPPRRRRRARHHRRVAASRWRRGAAGPCCPPSSPTGCGPATASRRSTGTTSTAST